MEYFWGMFIKKLIDKIIDNDIYFNEFLNFMFN